MLGRLRTDNDSHWYLIPMLFIAEFDELIQELEGKEYIQDPDKFDLFEEMFGKYRIDNPYKIDCILR